MDRQFRPYLPSDEAIRKRLQRSRRKDQPPLALTLEDLNIQGNHLEEVNSAEIILMFATAANLHHLGKADVWYGDGTFKVCPKLFYQLYTIHAEVHGQILPLVFSLLPSKSKKCYRFMWTKLNELMAQKGMHPYLKEFRSDLEIAPMKTLHLVFIPDSVSTCFFHFAQAHWRKIQSLGLMELYTSNEDYSLLLRCFTALAFVLEARIIEYFNLLCESVPEDAPTGITE